MTDGWMDRQMDDCIDDNTPLASRPKGNNYIKINLQNHSSSTFEFRNIALVLYQVILQDIKSNNIPGILRSLM